MLNKMFKFPPTPVIPTVYTDALSYGEQVGKLIHKVNECVDAINNFNVEIKDYVDEWLNEHPEATTTVLDHSLSFEKLINGTMGFVTPEMFGAIGDGETDDTQAIIEANDYAVENNCALSLTANYNTTSDCILQSSKSIICTGYIKNLWIRNTNGYFLINNCDNLKLTSVKNSCIIVGHIQNMDIISSESFNTMQNCGIAYNNFYGGFVHSVSLSGTLETEWINENHFYGIRMVNVSISGAYSQNNNIFDNVVIEGGTITLINAVSNHFKIRAESDYTLTISGNTYNNTIERTYALGNKLIFMNLPQLSLNGNIENNSFMKNYEKTNIFDLTNVNIWNDNNDYSNGTVYVKAYNTYEKTRIIPSNDCILRFNSDVACFRPMIRLYKNGNIILTQLSNVIGSGLTFDSLTGNYTLTNTVKNYSIGITKSTDFDEIEVDGYTYIATTIHEYKCDLYTLGEYQIYKTKKAILENDTEPQTSAPIGTTVIDNTGTNYGWYYNGTEWITM